MQTSRQLLASIEKRKRWKADRVAKELGESRDFVDQIRTGKRRFVEQQAACIADWLALDRLYVVACLRAEGAKRKGMKTYWERIARGAVTV